MSLFTFNDWLLHVREQGIICHKLVDLYVAQFLIKGDRRKHAQNVYSDKTFGKLGYCPIKKYRRHVVKGECIFKI